MDIETQVEAPKRWAVPRKTTAVIVAVIVAVGATGGGVYALMRHQAQKDAAAQQQEIDALQAKLSAATAAKGPTKIDTSPSAATAAPASSAVSPVAVSPTAGWLTYVDRATGFYIKYPPTWKITDQGPLDAGGAFAQFTSPELAQEVAAKTGETPTANVEIVFAGSVKEYLAGEHESAYATLESALAVKDWVNCADGTTNLGGAQARQCVREGMMATYSVLATKNGRVYQITFPLHEKKSELTETEQTMLDSFTAYDGDAFPEATVYAPLGNAAIQTALSQDYSSLTAGGYALVSSLSGFGDVNGDGSLDAVVVLRTSLASSAGSDKLVVFVNQMGAPVYAVAQDLGLVAGANRTVDQAVTVQDGVITAVIGTNEQDKGGGSTHAYKLVGGGLQEQ